MIEVSILGLLAFKEIPHPEKVESVWATTWKETLKNEIFPKDQ